MHCMLRMIDICASRNRHHAVATLPPQHQRHAGQLLETRNAKAVESLVMYLDDHQMLFLRGLVLPAEVVLAWQLHLAPLAGRHPCLRCLSSLLHAELLLAWQLRLAALAGHGPCLRCLSLLLEQVPAVMLTLCLLRLCSLRQHRLCW